MADSVYISTHLTKKQLQFLQLLEDYEILYFKMQNIEKRINQSFANLNEVLENLVDKKVLTRIERGVYAKYTYSNIQVLALFISKNGAIAYWSALHYHGLTERFPNTLFVKIVNRKRATNILGTAIKYISVKKSKCIGTITKGYGDNKLQITDIEMTLIDCFDQPHYAGDFDNLIKAFAQSNLSSKKMMTYTKAYSNIALIKRLGYLASLFHQNKLHSFIAYAQKQVNKKYSLLDSGGLEEGKFNARWMLRLNVSEEAIITMAKEAY